jgi:hypothetical protein
VSTLLNNELHVGEWIYRRIEDDTSLEVYADIIPAEAQLPAVRYQAQARTDIRGVGTHRIITQVDWLVVVTRMGHEIAPLVPLADAIDQALHDHTGNTSTIQVLSCVRLEPFTLLEVGDSGVYYRHAGGLYRTQSQPT